LEVLLNLYRPAIGKITGTGKMLKQSQEKEFNYFTDAKSINGVQNQMYIEKARRYFESIELIIKCR
jgi:hypothetical protein